MAPRSVGESCGLHAGAFRASDRPLRFQRLTDKEDLR